MIPKYLEADQIVNKFNFLLDEGFTVIREETLNYGAYVELKGNGIKIYLGFEFMTYTFYFYIYKFEDLQYSDSAYGKEIITFCHLAKKYNHEYDCSNLQPNEKDGCECAMDNNVNVLKKYGKKILSGKEWL